MAVAGVLALLAGTGTAKADDVIRLGGPSTDAKTMTLGFDGQAQTELMRGGGGRGGGGFHGGGFHGGGYRGGFYGGGYRGGFYGGGYRGGYYGGYRGGYYGGYRGYYRPYYAGYYRPFYRSYYPGFIGLGYGYGGYGYGGYGYGGYGNGGYGYGNYGYPYWPSDSYYPAPSYYPPDYGYPPAYNTPGMPYAPISTPILQVRNGNGSPYVDYYAAQRVVNGTVPTATPVNGTFQYDGGPSNPIPLPAPAPAPLPAPGPAPAPAKLPAAKAAPGTLFVSYPGQAETTAPARQTTQFAYPAYGEDTRATSFGTAPSAPTTKRTPAQTQR